MFYISRNLQVSVLTIFIFLAGCNHTLHYEDDDVAAIVKGNEITIGELRFLYSDDTVIESIDWAIIAELVKQEVKNMNLDAADDMIEEADQVLLTSLPPENTDNETEKSIRVFAESQADKLGMEPEKYHQRYVKKVSEQNAYMVTYIEEMLGELEGDSKEAMDKYNEKADNLLNELVKENEEELEILIQ